MQHLVLLELRDFYEDSDVDEILMNHEPANITSNYQARRLAATNVDILRKCRS